MKRFLLSVLLPAAALMARAEYTTMTFVTTDNATTVISANALSITFSGDNLLAESADRRIELPLAQMASMYFSEGDDLSAIETIVSDDTPADIFTIDGIHIGRVTSTAELRSQLPAGIYIIRNINGQICKFILTK